MRVSLKDWQGRNSIPAVSLFTLLDRAEHIHHVSVAFFNAHHKSIVWFKLLKCLSLTGSLLVYLWRVNMLPRCLVLALTYIFRSLPLSPLGFRKKKAFHFLLLCLPVSLICITTHGGCHSPLLALPFYSCFHLSGSINVSEKSGNGREQTGGQTERDGEYLGLFEVCVVF